MATWQYAMWGLAGGLVVEGLELRVAIRRCGDWPWRMPGEPGVGPMAVSVLLRLLAGAVLAPAMAGSGQISGEFGALSVGIWAPLLIEQITRQVPRPIPADPPQNAGPQAVAGPGTNPDPVSGPVSDPVSESATP